MKTCTQCRREQPEEEFSWLKRRGGKRMSQCKTCNRERMRAYYWANREVRRAANKAWREANREREVAKQAARNRALRLEVLEAYGGECTCCGERRTEFLCIDHINGGGRADRAANGMGVKYYRYLKVNGFPQEELRLLCHNCNQSLGLYGYCPHEADASIAL